jgi:hypothetical protein
MYRGTRCLVLRAVDDGAFRIITSDGLWAKHDGGWTQTDKFEWQKTVDASEIELIEEHYRSG